MNDENFLACGECGWSGEADEAMPAEGDEGAEVTYFCPECASLVLGVEG